jgi:predicted lipoprotein with Yx(FWY)xxD motif
MNRLILTGISIAATLAISACGGGGGGNSNAGPGGGTDTVSVKQLSGVGRALVDQGGKPIYSSDQEANGAIICTGSCNAFWKPVTPAGRHPTAGAGAGKLGVTKRPDGTMQVTASGRPLYTFSEDAPGKSTGDGFTDDFGGHHFTWHVVRTGGKTTSGSGGAGTAPDTGSSSGGNGY